MKNWFGALILLWCLGDASAAQITAYPDHPITIVITSVPGGVTDVVGKYYLPQVGAFFIYAVMVVTLIFRPQGLFGRRLT